MTPEEFLETTKIEPTGSADCGFDWFEYYTESDIIKLLEEYGNIKYDEGFVEGSIY